MITRVLAFAGGLLAAPFVVTALVRAVPGGLVVVAVVAIVAFGVLKGGVLRWAAAGFGVGFVGFQAVIAWVLHEWGTHSGSL